MKKIYILFFLFNALIAKNIQGQITILFVDDSADNFGNAELFYSSFDSVGFNAIYYNAVDSTHGPSEIVMNNYDLVVWHTSTQDNGLNFWNQIDEDNEALANYLEAGGKLWLVGNDFLFDRYSEAPVSFDEEEFPNKYLGIVSYDLQSYTQDGNLGVPLVIPDANSTIMGLNNLAWQFPTLWYVDGVSLANDALPIYRMGDENYVFADSISAVYYDNGSYQVLSYFFDLALVNNFNTLKSNVLPVLVFFSNLILANKETPTNTWKTSIYPNPTSNQINIELTLDTSTDISITLLDINGKLLTELISPQRLGSGTQTLKTNIGKVIPNGMYFLKINNDNDFALRPIVIQR